MTTIEQARAVEQRLRDQATRYSDPRNVKGALADADTIASLITELEAAQKDAEKLRSFLRVQHGHAPGWYQNKCIRCDKMMELVDKRCHICVECADAAIAAEGTK